MSDYNYSNAGWVTSSHTRSSINNPGLNCYDTVLSREYVDYE